MVLAVVAEGCSAHSTLEFGFYQERTLWVAPSAESSEIGILGKVAQLLAPGNGESGMWGEARSSTEPGRGAGNKGNFYSWKETNSERSWEVFLQEPWEVFSHTVPCSQTPTTALRQSRL